MSRLLVHIGLPKAGSTTLQAAFARSPDLHYLGKERATFRTPEMSETVRTVIPFDDLRLGPLDTCRAAFDAAMAGADGKLAVLSDELLSSVGFRTFGQSNSLPLIVDNLIRAAGQVPEIMLVVREQRDLMQSYYPPWVHDHGLLSFADFVELTMLRKSRFLQPVLNYPRLVQALRRQVETVHVLVFERLFADPDYRRAKFGAIGLGTAAGLIETTYERPGPGAIPAPEPRGELQSAFWSKDHQGLRLMAYADIFAHSPVRLPSSRAIVQRMARLVERQQAPTDTQDDGALGEEFDAMIRTFNKTLDLIDPNEDWGGLGYLR